MLQKQTVNVSFTEGIDTKTDDILSSKLDALENGFIGQEGTIRKRNGFDELAKTIDFSSSSVASGEVMVTSGDTIGIINQEGFFSYNPSRSRPWAAVPGNVKRYQVKCTPVNFPSLKGRCGSVTYEQDGNETVFVANYYTPTDGALTDLNYALFRRDDLTGAVRQTLPTVTSALCDVSSIVKVGTSLIQIVKTGSTIAASDVSTYSFTPSFTNILTDADATKRFNSFSVNGKLAICYVNTSAKPSVKFFNSALTLLGTLVMTETRPVDNGFALAWDAVNSRYAFFYSTDYSLAIKAVAIDTSFAQVGSTQSIPTASLGFSTEEPNFAKTALYNPNLSSVSLISELMSINGDSSFDVWHLSFNTSTVSFSTNDTVRDARIASGAALIDGKFRFVIAKEANVGSSNLGYIYNNYLVGDSFELVNKISNEYNDQRLYDTILANNTSAFAVPVTNQGPALITLQASLFNISSPREVVETGVVSLGGLWQFDGISFIEAGFPHAPKIYSASQAAGSVPVGSYHYVAVYEYIDARGNRHLSAPSLEQAVVVSGSAKKLTFDISPLNISLKSTSTVTTLLYRRLDTETSLRLVSKNGIDNLASFTGNEELLYTTGGVLDNDSPVVSSFSWVHGDRVFAINEERPNIVCFSNKTTENDILSNNRGMEFSNFLFISVNDNKTGLSDRVTCGASLDDKNIIFKNNSLYAVFGDGPNSLGQGGAFSEPKLVSTDVGCTEVRSIVLGSDGIYFKSSKGIYLLTRSLEVVYIGAPVEAYNNLEITSAVLLPDINQVRFTTRTGVALVYNYYYKQWSTFTNYDAAHATVWLGKYTHLKATGEVRTESNTYLDISSVIQMRISSGWLNASGIQNLQRIYRMMFAGHWKSSHNITCTISYDYENYVWDTYSISMLTSYNRTDKPTSTALYSGTNDGVYQYEILPSRQKCQSFKYEIIDTSITGESFALTGLSLLIGVKNGLNKLASNKKF